MLCSLCRYPEEICKCDSDMDWFEESKVVPNEDIKQSKGKIPLGNLLDFKHALQQVSKVREYGLTKYPDKESYKQIPTEMLMDACLRHLWKSGNDSESGVNHIYHAIVNLLMIGEKDKL